MFEIQQNSEEHIYLKVDHLPGLRRLGALPRDLQHGDPVAPDLLLEVAQLALHLVAPADFIDEFALERVDVRVKLGRKCFCLDRCLVYSMKIM